MLKTVAQRLGLALRFEDDQSFHIYREEQKRYFSFKLLSSKALVMVYGDKRWKIASNKTF